MQNVQPTQRWWPVREFTHLPSSVPLNSKASPSLLQDSLKLCFKCESQTLSQCNSSTCDLGTRGFLGETLSFVASVVIKQRHELDLESSAYLGINDLHFNQPKLSTSLSNPHAMLVSYNLTSYIITVFFLCRLGSLKKCGGRCQSTAWKSFSYNFLGKGGKKNVSQQSLLEVANSRIIFSSAFGCTMQ